MAADPDKPQPQKPPEKKKSRRDDPACKSAQMNRRMACGAPSSPRGNSINCTEAMIIQRQNCD